MSSSTSIIAAISVVSRTGALLYFKAFGAEDPSRLQLAIFASLDTIAEKVPDTRTINPLNPQQTPTAAPTDKFLGLLFPVEDLKLFGFLTNSNTKIILVVRDILLREDKVRELFRNVHRLLVDVQSNPFSSFDGRITAPAFEEGIYRLVEKANDVIEYKGPMPF